MTDDTTDERRKALRVIQAQLNSSAKLDPESLLVLLEHQRLLVAMESRSLPLRPETRDALVERLNRATCTDAENITVPVAALREVVRASEPTRGEASEPKPDPGTEHLIDGKFQSDKYPTCPRGKVPLSTKDPMAQDLLWEYAQRRRSVDDTFARDLETALRNDGYEPVSPDAEAHAIERAFFKLAQEWFAGKTLWPQGAMAERIQRFARALVVGELHRVAGKLRRAIPASRSARTDYAQGIDAGRDWDVRCIENRIRALESGGEK